MTAGQMHMEQLAEWLRQEKQTDKAQYEAKLDKFSVKQRVRQGITWYPVALRKDYLGTGERLVVELDRTAGIGLPHQLGSGSIVRWFSNAAGQVDMPSVSAVVNYVKGDLLVMTLSQDELPDWVRDGKLGVDLLFDEGSYRVMEETLVLTRKAENNRVAELREVLAGKLAPRFHQSEPLTLPDLNASQNKALIHALSAREVGLIHGPPGTGKTTTLVATVGQVVQRENQTLVCAASNAAVDLLVDKLAKLGLRVLRLGHPARVTEEALQHTLDHQLTLQPEHKELKKLRKQADEYRALAKQYKRNFGKEERQQRQMLLRESKDLKAEARRLENYMLDRVSYQTQVFCCTLTGANHVALSDKRFKTVFIDEAAQAPEPACWIPLQKAGRVILAGDHHQLPPTVKDLQVAKAGYARTLFERLALDRKVGEMLETQYRMHAEIMQFSSQYFYHGRLEAHESVASRKLEELEPITFLDTAGTGFEEKVNVDTLSTGNPEEARLLLQRAAATVAAQPEERRQTLRIGVIAPYRAQVDILKDLLADFPELVALGKQLAISTVDSFQGQERDIIAISLTRSNEKGEIGFLADVRRMNVAMTRAKLHLLMVGDSATLGNHAFYKAVLDYVQALGYYHSAFEYIY